MNILQILPALEVGGVETGTVDIAKGLAARGHKCVVISSGGALVDELVRAGIKHYELPVHKKSLFSIIACRQKVAGIIRDEKIDVVHARSRVPAWIAYFACRKTQAQFVTTCHGHYSRHFFSRPMSWGKRVIVASDVMREHMMAHFGVPQERIRLIPRGVDLEKFKFRPPDAQPKKNYIIGNIGRLTPLKGQADFIRAIAKTVKKNPYIEAWIVGDASEDKKEYKDQLITLANTLGVSRYIRFFGTRYDIPELLEKMDALVLATTTEEAFGRVIIEAAAAGVPVIGTSIGGISDIIEDRKTGLLVPPGAPDKICAAILELLKERALASSLAAAARKKVEEEYNLDLMIERTYEIYRQAKAISSILVIKFSAAGDLILITPSLRALRSNFPDAKIYLATSKELKPLIRDCPYIDEIIAVTLKEKSRSELFRAGTILRRNGIDAAIDLQNNKASHILAYLSGAFRRYGYDNGKLSFLLNNRIKGMRLPIPPVAHQFRVLNMLGIKPKDERLELWESAQDDDYIDRLFSRLGIAKTVSLIGINAGASRKWLTKRWPEEKTAGLIDALAGAGREIVLLGSAGDLGSAQKIAGLSSAKPHILTGMTSLSQLVSLIKRLDILISPDSAPVHIAAAKGVPFVALFGPTDPKRHTPPARDYIIIKKDLKCSPCYKPNCSNIRCMKKIEVEEVRAAAEELLKSRQSV